MAQRVNVVLEDDIDGTDADETVTFALDGVSYEIDLSAGNADKLRSALALYIGHGRKVSGRRKAAGTSTSRRSTGSTAGPSAADIRAWARENGYDVPERGRVSADVREAYAAAH